MDKNERVLVQVDGKTLGPFLVDRLRRVKGFTPQTLVSYPGSDKWAPAHRMLSLKGFFEGRLDIRAETETSFQINDLESILQMPTKRRESKAFFGKILPKRNRVDTWFPRVVRLNIFLAAVGVAGMLYKPELRPMSFRFPSSLSQKPNAPTPAKGWVVKRFVANAPPPLTSHRLRTPVRLLSPDAIAAYQKEFSNHTLSSKRTHTVRRGRISHPLS